MVYKVILKTDTAQGAEHALTLRLEGEAGQPYGYDKGDPVSLGGDLHLITVTTDADLAPLFRKWENEEDSPFLFFNKEK